MKKALSILLSVCMLATMFIGLSITSHAELQDIAQDSVLFLSSVNWDKDSTEPLPQNEASIAAICGYYSEDLGCDVDFRFAGTGFEIPANLVDDYSLVIINMPLGKIAGATYLRQFMKDGGRVVLMGERTGADPWVDNFGTLISDFNKLKGTGDPDLLLQIGDATVCASGTVDATFISASELSTGITTGFIPENANAITLVDSSSDVATCGGDTIIADYEYCGRGHLTAIGDITWAVTSDTVAWQTFCDNLLNTAKNHINMSSVVTLDKTTLDLREGTSSKINVTITPSEIVNKAVNFESKDTTIATVDTNGVVKGIKQGKTTIIVTADFDGHTALCEVEVYEGPTGSEVEVYGAETGKIAGIDDEMQYSSNGTTWKDVPAGSYSVTNLPAGVYTLRDRTTLDKIDTIIIKQPGILTGDPVVSGDPYQGSELKCDVTAITTTVEDGCSDFEVPAAEGENLQLQFQWYKDGVAISGANSDTYTLTAGDIGSKIECGVSSEKFGSELMSNAVAASKYTAPADCVEIGRTYHSVTVLVQDGIAYAPDKAGPWYKLEAGELMIREGENWIGKGTQDDEFGAKVTSDGKAITFYRDYYMDVVSYAEDNPYMNIYSMYTKGETVNGVYYAADSEMKETGCALNPLTAKDIAKALQGNLDNSETTYKWEDTGFAEKAQNNLVTVTVDPKDGNYVATLNNDINGTLEIPNTLGAFSINLNGFNIIGANGTEESPAGQPGVKITKGEPGTQVTFKETNEEKKGYIAGGNAYPGTKAAGGEGIVGEEGIENSAVTVDEGVSVLGGKGSDGNETQKDGGNGGSGIKGPMYVYVNYGGVVTGGNGGDGFDTGAGGAGGAGIDTDKDVDVTQGTITGGNGGKGGENGGNGGNGGNGVNGDDVNNNGGKINGGNGGSGNKNGSNGQAVKKAAQTGDTGNIAYWAGLMGLCVLGFLGTMFFMKKKQENENAETK